MANTEHESAEAFAAMQEKLASATDWRDYLPVAIKESLKVKRPVELRSLNTDDPHSSFEAARKDLLEQLGEVALDVKAAA